ncbi:anthranilate phosphoribosyltransferase [Aliiglaciecola lipolytica]|uniref:Anthranilate phosphoribosyltransferase n=1 Tax=Aliiglaciecola lipolytica E3 TaxID=1127673 RepID=K6YDH3_9ALTE|nr:anthranilate phosphoribosyltransferase [Aliiglaciecola lipolytica E3]
MSIDTLSQLESLYKGQDLSQQACEDLFSKVVKGELNDIVISSMLTALKIKGEKPSEIAGAAAALINNAAPFPRPDYPFADIVGTGGDGHNTINISSAAAIVAASCGVKVAKHGNRSVSSKSGSADLFREFGMDLGMSAQTARNCLDEAGLCFLFAPNYHAGIKYAMPVRTTLKTRTLFNLLGPLANPGKPTHMMIGVYAPEWVMPFAKTLKLLGYEHALVVHGNGLDELALHGPSQVAELNNGTITEYTLSPADFGLQEYSLESIKGGEPEENKTLIEAVLSGQGKVAHQSAVALNAGALLKLTGIATTYQQGAQLAIDAMQSKQALATILSAAKISQQGVQ